MISIVIPAYKNVDLVKKALESVFRQNYQNYEVILVDDTPDESVKKICSIFKTPKLHYYHNTPPKGAVDNWNYGLSLANGNNIILLHHDESFINPDFLERIESLLNNYSFVIHNKKILLSSKEKRERIPNWLKTAIIKMKYPIFSMNVIGPCACVAFRREIMEKFDNRLHWKVDTEWYYRILQKADSMYYSPNREILSIHGHEDQITSSLDIKKVNMQDIKVIKEKYNNPVVSMFLRLGQCMQAIKILIK